MAKKGLENFTDKVAKDLIKKQSIRDEQRKIREEYLANKYKEALDLTNDIEVYIKLTIRDKLVCMSFHENNYRSIIGG